MTSTIKKDLLRKLPSIDDLLGNDTVVGWLREHPRGLVTDCLRSAVEQLREQILKDEAGRCGLQHVTPDFVLELAGAELDKRTQPHLRKAINATGIILHTALGRAVWPASVVDSMVEDLKGYVTLAVDRETGQRLQRDKQIEYILTELTGAEAATVVNNNAAATMIVLAALASDREVIVSRGELIEIGGSFRLPDVMVQSGARLVEVGATNCTHLRDYENAITQNTAAIMRVHPSNYRIVGFTSRAKLGEIVELSHSRGFVLIDDLGSGALIDLEQFHLPHEPTPAESIAAGADIVLFSADKLIGASQGGIIVGREELINRIRTHPLARAFRVDKTCLMALERTLQLFRDPQLLCQQSPTYRMLTVSVEELQTRADALGSAIADACADAETQIAEGVGYLGSGSLPMEELATRLVLLSVGDIKPMELARRLRLDEACIFTRIEDEKVVFDVRTLADEDVPRIAEAVKRISR